MNATRAPDDTPIQVVIIEDSPVQTSVLTELLEEDTRFRVVGTAATGKAGFDAVARLRPQLILCDIGLPDTDGFDVVSRIMGEHPTPLVVVTASLTPEDRTSAFHALSLGAVAVYGKPAAALLNSPSWRAGFRKELALIATAPVIPHIRSRLSARRAAPPRPPPRPTSSSATERILVIVGSAGSPGVVRRLLGELLAVEPLPIPSIVALHMGPNMGEQLARFLGQGLPASTRQAESEAALQAGVIYVAPGGVHTEVTEARRLSVRESLPDHKWGPSLDHLLGSIAVAYGRYACGVLLTGMGSDGAQGMGQLRRAGALTIGQTEQTCLVAGMPRAARQAGALSEQLPPERIPGRILAWLGESTS